MPLDAGRPCVLDVQPEDTGLSNDLSLLSQPSEEHIARSVKLAILLLPREGSMVCIVRGQRTAFE